MSKQIKLYATEYIFLRGRNRSKNNEELFSYNKQSKETEKLAEYRSLGGKPSKLDQKVALRSIQSSREQIIIARMLAQAQTISKTRGGYEVSRIKSVTKTQPF